MAKDYSKEELIKSIYYMCTTNILKEMVKIAEQYKKEDRSLEEFDKILPEVTKEYVRLTKNNKRMIARLNTEMWEWFKSISKEEFSDFVKNNSKDFDVCIDVKPVGEYVDGEVKLYDKEQ